MTARQIDNRSYNAGIDAAQSELARTVNDTGDEAIFAFYIKAAGRLERIKRRLNQRKNAAHAHPVGDST